MANSSVGEYELSSADLNLQNHGNRKRSRSPERFRARSVVFNLSDLDVLDCPNCSEPFTVMVFKCPNGHLSCIRCCRSKLWKCHSCSEMLGDNRCRSIENIVEAVKVPCCNEKHGCRKKVSYSLIRDHEKVCRYAPNYQCPFTFCSFRASPRSLQQHIIQEHEDHVIDFHYDTTVSLHPTPVADFSILREVTESDLFIVILDEELLVKCLEPEASKGKFNYEVTIRSNNSCLRFQSITEATMSINNWNEISREDSFVVPRHFFKLNGFLSFDICIFSKDTNNARARTRICPEDDQSGIS